MSKTIRLLFLLDLVVVMAMAQTPCNETDMTVGSSPQDNSNAGPFTGHVSFMIDHNNDAAYQITCCGVIESVNLVASAAGTQTLQVWSAGTGATSTTHTLIGAEPLVISTTGSETNVPLTNPISVVSGYRYGWHGNPNIILHKASGSSAPERVNRFATTSSIVSVGSTFEWSASGGADFDNIQYSPAFELVLGPGNKPTLSSSPVSPNLNTADAIGTSVDTITASDLDAQDILTPITMTDTSGLFTFDGTSVTTQASLVGITRTESISFSVSDQCGYTSDAFSVSVLITNDPPSINNLPSYYILSEDTSADTLLHTISVTDSVDTVTCTLNGGDTTEFKVILIPGTLLYGIYARSTASFSYSTTMQYDLTINCDDIDPANQQTGRYTVYIVKNAAPVVSNLQAQTSVPTTTTVNSVVFTVAATDAEGDAITYSMTCPNDPTCPFTISPTTGAISLTSDITSSTTTGYDVSVIVNDPTNTLSAKILSIIITNINDPIAISNLPLTANYPVNENTAISTPIFTVTSKDQDTAQTKTYSMTSTGSGLTYFTIDPSSGVISTGLSTMDYETLAAGGTTSFTLTVSVTDGISTDSETLVIDIINVNENPVFSQTSYSLTANEGSANTVIGTPSFGVVDPDTGDTQVYEMTCGNGYFFMDSSSGQVKFQSDYDIDKGLPTSVTCSVTVTDSGGLTDTATLILTIVDTNDHTPTFLPTQYTFYADYYSGVATSIGRLTASDGDSSTYGTLVYSLDQTNLPDQYFTVDASGHVTLTQSLSGLGYGQMFTITGLVYDSGGLSDTSSIQIIIGETTTAPTTGSSTRYRTFAEDSRNIPWLVFSVVTLLFGVGALCWVGFTCRGSNSISATCRTWRRMRLHRPRMFPKKAANKPQKDSSPTINLTIRRPPPAKVNQTWRAGGEGAPAGSVMSSI